MLAESRLRVILRVELVPLPVELITVETTESAAEAWDVVVPLLPVLLADAALRAF